MFINGMFPLSSRTKHWARVVIDSVWLINTFFVVFRGSEGRSTGLTISESLFERGLPNSFLCQIIAQSLGKNFGNAAVYVSFPCPFGKHKHVKCNCKNTTSGLSCPNTYSVWFIMGGYGDLTTATERKIELIVVSTVLQRKDVWSRLAVTPMKDKFEICVHVHVRALLNKNMKRHAQHKNINDTAWTFAACMAQTAVEQQDARAQLCPLAAFLRKFCTWNFWRDWFFLTLRRPIT